MKKVIIIPARLFSERFPNKVLFPIYGIPMIIRTWTQAKKVLDCSVYIASDDESLLSICREYGCVTVKTGTHRNGTERCAEAARILNLEQDDYILNVQADIPYIDWGLLEKLFKTVPYHIVTAAAIVRGVPSSDSNLVKIILDRNQNALYFSRLPVPIKAGYWYNHIGVYGFTNALLQEYATQSISILEQQEDLEQLRILYHAKRRIRVLLTDDDYISVNVPSDIDKLVIEWPEGQVTGHVI